MKSSTVKFFCLAVLAVCLQLATMSTSAAQDQPAAGEMQVRAFLPIVRTNPPTDAVGAPPSLP